MTKLVDVIASLLEIIPPRELEIRKRLQNIRDNASVVEHPEHWDNVATALATRYVVESDNTDADVADRLYRLFNDAFLALPHIADTDPSRREKLKATQTVYAHFTLREWRILAIGLRRMQDSDRPYSCYKERIEDEEYDKILTKFPSESL